MAKVAFLGLGVMGFPMAGHLAAKGHDVTVYNRTFAKAEAWTKKHKGKAAKTPKEAAAGQEIVFSCVGDDNHLRAVMFGENGALAGMAKGAILFDNTTASADIVEASSAPVAEPSRMPPTAPQPAMAPTRPRRPGGARSTMKTIEVVYSPPTDRPWIMRRSVRMIGAAMPSTS